MPKIDNSERAAAERKDQEIAELVRQWEVLSSIICRCSDNERKTQWVVEAEEIESILKNEYDYEL